MRACSARAGNNSTGHANSTIANRNFMVTLPWLSLDDQIEGGEMFVPVCARGCAHGFHAQQIDSRRIDFQAKLSLCLVLWLEVHGERALHGNVLVELRHAG